MNMALPASIALVDDHVMIRKALASMIESFGEYQVVLQSSNGHELLTSLSQLEKLPDLILLDIQMPGMDGIEAAKQLSIRYPDLKFMALSMKDNEDVIIRMIKHGARGYVLKDGEPASLKQALNDVLHKGFHYSDLVTGRMVHQLQHGAGGNGPHVDSGNINTREHEFLRLSCTELTYKEIAEKLHVSPRTIDGYRDNLFEKLGVKSRVGLAMFAVRMGLV